MDLPYHLSRYKTQKPGPTCMPYPLPCFPNLSPNSSHLSSYTSLKSVLFIFPHHSHPFSHCLHGLHMASRPPISLVLSGNRRYPDFEDNEKVYRAVDKEITKWCWSTQGPSPLGLKGLGDVIFYWSLKRAGLPWGAIVAKSHCISWRVEGKNTPISCYPPPLSSAGYSYWLNKTRS